MKIPDSSMTIEQSLYSEEADFAGLIETSIPKLLTGVPSPCTASTAWTSTLESCFDHELTPVTCFSEPNFRFRNKFATVMPLEHPDTAGTTYTGFTHFQQRCSAHCPSESCFAHIRCDEFLHCEQLRAELSVLKQLPGVSQSSVTLASAGCTMRMQRAAADTWLFKVHGDLCARLLTPAGAVRSRLETLPEAPQTNLADVLVLHGQESNLPFDAVLFVPQGWFYELSAVGGRYGGWVSALSRDPALEAALAQLNAWSQMQARLIATLPASVRLMAAAESSAAAALVTDQAEQAIVEGTGKPRAKCVRQASALVACSRRHTGCSVNPLHTRLVCADCSKFWKQSADGIDDDDLTVYCVNLDRRPDRWAAVQQEMHKLRGFAGVGGEGEIQLVRVPAVDGRQIDCSQFAEEVALEWDNSAFAKLWKDMKPGELRTLTAGEVGCAMSHVNVWRAVAANGTEGAALVIEDDVMFTDDIAMRLPGYIRQLPPKWDLAYLGGIKIGRHKRIAPNVIVPECYLCTHAYLISAAGATKLLQRLPVRGPVDHFMAENFRSMHAYALTPALAHQPQHLSAAVESEDSDVAHTLQRVQIATNDVE